MARKDIVRNFWPRIRKLSEENLDLKILLLLIAFLTLTNLILLYLHLQKRTSIKSPSPSPISSVKDQVPESISLSSNLNLHASTAGLSKTDKSLLSLDHSWTATLSAEKKITMIATGDVIPARSVNYQMSKKNDFTWPFEKTHDYLKSADITLINLESPLIKNCPITNEGMAFCGNQRFVEGLKLAGIDVANLANNHSENWGPEGLYQTIELLKNNQILVTGFTEDFGYSNQKDFPRQLATKKIKEITFGFLGFNILTLIDERSFLQSIKAAKKKVDLLIVSVHWGTEYTHEPSTSQKELAYRIIDEGADITIGNHPHWIQPVEIYKGKPVIYAHGNFIFDQGWSEKTKLGIVTKFTFFDKKLIDIEFKPIKIESYGQPHLLEGKEAQETLNLLETINKNLQK